MGTKMAPTYATQILAYLKEYLYEIIVQKYSNNKKREFTRSWKRYLEIVSYSGNAYRKTFTNYTSYSQTYIFRIKFTMERSSKELPFLDILIKNENSQIITDIYQKPIDT